MRFPALLYASISVGVVVEKGLVGASVSVSGREERSREVVSRAVLNIGFCERVRWVGQGSGGYMPCCDRDAV